MQTLPNNFQGSGRTIVGTPGARILVASEDFPAAVYAAQIIYESGGVAIALIVMDANGDLTPEGRRLVEQMRLPFSDPYATVWVKDKFEFWRVGWFLDKSTSQK